MNIEKLVTELPHAKELERLLGIATSNKVIHVPPQLGTSDEYASNAILVLEYIRQQLDIKGLESIIILELISEGFDWNFIKYSDILIRELVTKHSVSYDNIIYITSAADVHMNNKKYYKYCIENNCIPL